MGNIKSLGTLLVLFLCLTTNVRAQNNNSGSQLFGYTWFKNGFTLHDFQTTGVFDSPFPVSGDIDLKGGTLDLKQDLLFHNVTHLKGLGTIVGNNHLIDLCTSITCFPESTSTISNAILHLRNDLTIPSHVTFQGHCIIQGDNNIISLGHDGNITLDKNSVLELHNVIINNVTSSNLNCTDNTGSLVIRNSRLIAPYNFELSAGSIRLVNTYASLPILDGKTLTSHNGVLSLDNIPVMWSYTNERFIGCHNHRVNDCCNPCPPCPEPCIISPCVKSALDVLESCCAQLRTSTGFLQSEIDVLKECDACTLISRIEVLETCCEELRTSTGFLQSEIDSCCTDLQTSTGFLQSEIDACCNGLTSRIEILETCCEQLRTSTGFLQSEIDVCSCIIQPSNCAINFLTKADVSTRVNTGDWSFDGKFVAIGLAAGLDNKVVKVYELVGSVLELRAELAFTQLGDVSDIRWLPHATDDPGIYRLAVGRFNVGIGQPHLHILDFNSSELNPALALTEVSVHEFNNDVFAVSWRLNPLPLPSGNDVLAVGRSIPGSQLALYTVDSFGSLTGPISPITTNGQVQLKAIDWDATGEFIAVGTTSALRVYQFDSGLLSLSLNAQGQFGATVLAVDWNPVFQHLIAVGLAGAVTDFVQVFEHSPTGGIVPPGTLTHKCGIPDLFVQVNAVDWHPLGTCLALGKDGGLNGGEFRTYAFDEVACTFNLVSFFDNFNDQPVHDVRWTFNGQFVLNTNSNNNVSIYGLQGSISLISIIEALQTCCEQLRTSTGFLQSQIDDCCSELKTSTGFLQSEIDVLQQCDPCSLISRIEILETCCEDLRTSTGFLQSQIDDCCAELKTSTGFLQSQIDDCCAELKTSTGFLQSQIDDCCTQLQTSTGFLQSQIDDCCTELKTSTGFLQSQIDDCCTQLQTSTGFLQSQIDDCCAELKTSTGFLQSQLDDCCTQLQTSTGFLQSQIDDCCAELQTSTGFLQSQIDVLQQCDPCSLISRIEVLETCCEDLRTSTGFLQSEIDDCCAELQTSTGFLQSQIDDCCAELQTSSGFLQSEIDVLQQCDPCSLISRIEILETCCEELRTSTGFLQSEIDFCCGQVPPPTLDCVITITTDTFYDPITRPEMQPPAGGAVVFQFSPCVGANEIPRLIFNADHNPLNDPALFPDATPDQVVLPVDSQMIFQGTGFVELEGVGTFTLAGVHDDNAVVPADDMTTPPNLVTQDKATMHLAENAQWTIRGVGRYILREDGQLTLDHISQLIFGADPIDQLQVLADGASSIIIDVQPSTITINETDNAFISFQLGQYSLDFINHSALDIRRGIFEINTNKGQYVPGSLTQFTFVDSSSIQIQRNIEIGDSIPATWLGLAPNVIIDGAVQATLFDNRTGVIYGNGDVRYRSFDASNVDSTLLMQNNFFVNSDIIKNQFLRLVTKISNERSRMALAQIAPSDNNILAELGAFPDQTQRGQLVALRPNPTQIDRDGSIQILSNGDHDVAYRGNPTVGITIVGHDINGRYFEISAAGVRVTF